MEFPPSYLQVLESLRSCSTERQIEILYTRVKSEAPDFDMVETSKGGLCASWKRWDGAPCLLQVGRHRDDLAKLRLLKATLLSILLYPRHN